MYFHFAEAFGRVFQKIAVQAGKVVISFASHQMGSKIFLRHNFPSQRSACIILSEIEPLVASVPQGGVISPILFDVYVSNLAKVVQNFGLSTKMYANGLKIYKIISDPNDATRLQMTVSSLVKWTKEWQLPLPKRLFSCSSEPVLQIDLLHTMSTV